MILSQSVGDYHACARVCQVDEPPAHATNRGIIMEGLCCFIGGFLGGGVSVTTYSENVGVIGITGVASRRTMQIAGLMLMILGIFTKFGAILATLPDPIVGGILATSISMVGGVGLSSVQLVDLKLSRNVAILGISIMIGLMVPAYIKENPIHTGLTDLDQLLKILLSIQMFVGGLVAFILDNTVPGATRQQRGLKPLFQHSCRPHSQPEAPESPTSTDVYTFRPYVMKFLQSIPGNKWMPFLPTFSAFEQNTMNAHLSHDNSSKKRSKNYYTHSRQITHL